MSAIHDSLVQSAREGTSAQRRKLQPGEILIHEGDNTSSVYVLLEGGLKVTRAVSGDSAALAKIEQPGSIVGEMSSIGGGKRSATVTATAESEVLEFESERFVELVEADPAFTRDLVALATRRAEEGELASLLADHFGVVDDELLMSTCATVRWVRLSQGEVLLREGDLSDAAYFVVRGRLQARQRDPETDDEVVLGESGRGDVVGEMGLLGGTPRTATVTAVRDSVLAELDEASFLGLVDRQPRLLIRVALNAAARTQGPRWHSSSDVVVAVAAPDSTIREEFITGIVDELGRLGAVGVLSPRIVDTMLGFEGASEARPGEVGDVSLSRLVNEVELTSDHLLLDMGTSPAQWARRVHGIADRLLLVTTPDAGAESAEHLGRLVGEDHGVPRTLVVVHSANAEPPTDTAELMARFGADDVLHVARGSVSDIRRVARVSVGRGNTLVLGGGGARGFAHIGVLRAVEELGIELDIVGGASIGGIIGSAIADRWPSPEILRWTERHFPKAMDYTIPLISLTKGERIVRGAQETFGDRTIEDLWRTYFCASTNLSAGRTHVHRSGSVIAALRATSAIPGVIPPVPHDGDLLVDGGVLNNLPIDIGRTISPHGRMIAVDVAPPRGPGAHADYGLSVSGWEAIRSMVRSDGRYPRMSAVLMRSMIAASMQERDRNVRDRLADCYLALDMRGISMLDFHDPAAAAERGFEAAKPLLEQWLSQTDG